MQKSLYGFILRYSLHQQVILTVLSVASFVPYYFYLSLPKAIVNQGIIGQGITFPATRFGFAFSHAGYLVMLTLIFLGLVLVQQAFKYSINVYQGISGERMLRRMRYELYACVLRFPLTTFRHMSSGEIIPMITAETEALGGFVGIAFSVPLFQGGMFMVSLGFLFVQNWRIAAAALLLYPFQLYVVPKMQYQVNQLGKARVKSMRRLSDRVGESISGIEEIHAHNGSKHMLAQFSDKLGEIYWIRYRIYQRKHVIKFLNNFMQQLGPFLFYLIGGYLAIEGKLDVGTVIAAVAAQKEMGAPLKELLNYYQQQQDARIKYDQVVMQFDPPGLRENAYLLAEPEKGSGLSGDFQVSNLTLSDEQGVSLLDGVSFSGPSARHVAILGEGGSGRGELALLLAHLIDPNAGHILLGGIDLATLPESVTGRRMAYVGPSAFIFATTIEANLFFGLRHRPILAADYEGEDLHRFQRRQHESSASGNSTDDTFADWTDYGAAGVADKPGLYRAGLKALDLVGMLEDVFNLGLRGVIDPAAEPDLAAQILKARADLRARLREPGYAQLVEGWDPGRFNSNATVAENLLFGSPADDSFAIDGLAQNPYVLKVLADVGLTETFLRTGLDIASTMVELFADLPPDHEFFQQFSFISSDDLPLIQDLLSRADRDHLEQLPEEDRMRLMSLPFKVIPARHRLGVIDGPFIAKVLEARAAFARELPPSLAAQVAFFHPDAYTATASLQDNILFGKLVYGQVRAAERLGQLLSEVIRALGLSDRIAEVGLGFDCGIAGGRLSAAQRQKLAIARGIVKRPDIMILSDATAVLDAASQSRILDGLRQEFAGRGLIWSLARASLAAHFDHVLVMQSGRLAEQGSFADLAAGEGPLKALLAQE